MPTQLKSDTARENGAQSHGPVTPEGKAISSRNSTRHGLRSKAVVMANESAEEFESLRQGYIDQFHPATLVEMDLVETMASARWRLRRLMNVETNLLWIELVQRRASFDSKFRNIDEDERLSLTFQKLADDGQALKLIPRYEGELNRTYDRAFRQLQQLQAARRKDPPPPEPEQPNEPTPVPIRVDSRSFVAEEPNEPTPITPNGGPPSETLLA